MPITPAPPVLPLFSKIQFFMVTWVKLELAFSTVKQLVGFIKIADP